MKRRERREGKGKRQARANRNSFELEMRTLEKIIKHTVELLVVGLKMRSRSDEIKASFTIMSLMRPATDRVIGGKLEPPKTRVIICFS
jgi:hypothetical protein